MVCWGGAGVGQPCFLSQLSPLAFLPLPGYRGRPLEWGLSRTASSSDEKRTQQQAGGWVQGLWMVGVSRVRNGSQWVSLFAPPGASRLVSTSLPHAQVTNRTLEPEPAGTDSGATVTVSS